jgi:predicted DNA repair protein MutK
LGVKYLDPDALKLGDSLYALMGFDETLTRSLIGSIRMHFDVLSVIGGPNMLTVGDAISFAQEVLESRDEE